MSSHPIILSLLFYIMTQLQRHVLAPQNHWYVLQTYAVKHIQLNAITKTKSEILKKMTSVKRANIRRQIQLPGNICLASARPWLLSSVPKEEKTKEKQNRAKTEYKSRLVFLLSSYFKQSCTFCGWQGDILRGLQIGLLPQVLSFPAAL